MCTLTFFSDINMYSQWNVFKIKSFILEITEKLDIYIHIYIYIQREDRVQMHYCVYSLILKQTNQHMKNLTSTPCVGILI